MLDVIGLYQREGNHQVRLSLLEGVDKVVVLSELLLQVFLTVGQPLEDGVELG